MNAYNSFQPINDALSNIAATNRQNRMDERQAAIDARNARQQDLEYQTAQIAYQNLMDEQAVKQRIRERAGLPPETVSVPRTGAYAPTPEYTADSYAQDVVGGQFKYNPTPLQTAYSDVAQAYNGGAPVDRQAYDQKLAAYQAMPTDFKMPQAAPAGVAKMYSPDNVPYQYTQTKEFKPGIMDIAAEEYAKAGMPDKVAEIRKLQVGSTTAEDWVNSRRAMIEQMGGEQQLAQFDATLGKMKKVEEIMGALLKQDPSGNTLKAYFAQNPNLGIDPNMFKMRDGIPTVVTQNGVMFWQDPLKQQWHVYEPKQEAKSMDSVDLGDRVKIIPRDGSAPYYEPKAAKPDTMIKLTMGDKPKPAKPLPATQVSELSDFKQMINNLNDITSIQGKVETGPASGRVQSAGQYVGASSKDFNNLKQKLAAVNNIILKLRSGAAVTDQEYTRFLQEMPTVNDAPDVFKTKLSNAIQYMSDLQNAKLTAYEETGYKIPESARVTSITVKNPQGMPNLNMDAITAELNRRRGK